MVAGGLDSLLLVTGRPSPCENVVELSSLPVSFDLMDVCRLFYLTRAPRIFLPEFSSNIRQKRPNSGPLNTTWYTFQNRNQTRFSDHSKIKPEVNSRKVAGNPILFSY